jgi:SPX domain protein involved in polyphosphate accumulation
MAIPLRHELKYLLSPLQADVVRRHLQPVLSLDPHTAKNGGQYSIRSLYFDTAFDDALYDKMSGIYYRQKYRIRIYNYSDRSIFLECKSKYGDLISKRSLKIPRDLADQLIAGDPDGLENTNYGLLSDVFREMRTRLLHPVVIVDYDREAYLHPAETVRITLDKNLHSGLSRTDMFNPYVPTVSPFDQPWTILEVKYDRVLPPYIAELLSWAVPEACRSAVSKYTWCRRFEGKDDI